jgi:membrane associated rhomboid family serine protease
VAVYVLQAAVPWRIEGWIVTHLGFVPARYSVAGALDWAAFLGPVTHQFLHGGVVHLLINMVMLAAFGSGVARTIGGTRMIVLYLLCGVAGAFTHGFVYPESSIPVIGASGAISGLFGAVLRLIAQHRRVDGGLSRVLPVAIIWVGIAVMTGFTGMPGAEGAQVAWAAHIGGFIPALLLFDLFALGSRRRFRS